MSHIKSLTTHEKYGQIMNIQEMEEYGLRMACERGHLDVVKWLTSSEEMKEAQEGAGCWKGYANIHAENDFGFRMACLCGSLDVVKWLTSSEEMREAQEGAGCWNGYANIHAENDFGFRMACLYGSLDVVKWLTSSEEMKEAQEGAGCWNGYVNVHAMNEDGFRRACENRHLELVKWLLFERDYEPIDQRFKVWSHKEGQYWDMNWKEWLKRSEYKEVLEMVRVRDEKRAIKAILVNQRGDFLRAENEDIKTKRIRL